MARSEPNTANLVIGGTLLGVWIFMALGFGVGSDEPTWGYGGLLAFGIVGATYASKSLQPEARTPIYIGMGLLVGFALMALALEGLWFQLMPGLIGFLLALWGASLIVKGLPQEMEPARDHEA